MYDIFLDAFIDSVKMIPFLLFVYILIEYIEYKFGRKIRDRVKKAGAAGPLVGAIAGSVPQCGFSVMATALYTQRLTTIGTLLAVYIATSDEAIPIILSRPDKIGVIIPLVVINLVIALVAGYLVDFIFRKKNKEILEHVRAFDSGLDSSEHNHEKVLNEPACCHHSINCDIRKFGYKEIFVHPLVHTLKIFIYIFIISLVLNWIIYLLGENFFINLFSRFQFLQVLFSALVGLIPNCAASVAITELYLQGVISFGAVVAGLCASGGLGILILFKEEKDKKDALKVIAILFIVSILSGLFVQYFFS